MEIIREEKTHGHVEEFQAGGEMIALLLASFFTACKEHAQGKMNYCCIDCAIALCSSCLPTHYKHRLIQIRKYVYQNVVNVKELRKFFCVKGIQTYSTNNAKVLHLRSKPPQMKSQHNGSKNGCLLCDGSLQGNFLYCCLACKVLYEDASFELGNDSPHSPLSNEMNSNKNNDYDETSNTENNGHIEMTNSEKVNCDGTLTPFLLHHFFLESRR